MTAPWTRDGDDEWSFDEYLPPELQLKSFVHFTSLPVARHAVRLLAPTAGMRILDVGSGPGKFCLVAAHEAPQASFVGIEQRKHLVYIATRLAERWAVPNVSFIHGDVFALDWSGFDAFYLFNPFAEQLFKPWQILDDTIEHDPKHFIRYVTATYKRLAQARAGTRVVTHHGFGAPPPLDYELASDTPPGPSSVELWIKRR